MAPPRPQQVQDLEVKSQGCSSGPRGSHGGAGTAVAARGQGHSDTALTDTPVSPVATSGLGGVEDVWVVLLKS